MLLLFNKACPGPWNFPVSLETALSNHYATSRKNTGASAHSYCDYKDAAKFNINVSFGWRTPIKVRANTKKSSRHEFAPKYRFTSAIQQNFPAIQRMPLAREGPSRGRGHPPQGSENNLKLPNDHANSVQHSSGQRQEAETSNFALTKSHRAHPVSQRKLLCDGLDRVSGRAEFHKRFGH